jgi:hypothetical protein
MVRTIAAVAFCCLWALGAAGAEYHGFSIDDRAGGAGLSPAAAASVVEQLRMVELAGLPMPVLASFKATPIVVDAELRGNPGVFSVLNGEPVVRIRPIVFPSDKPILLHELLHAYHYRVLTMRNPDIEQAYRYAKSHGLFPQFQSAHFLENPKEFFAVTGSLYLFGDIQQPPFRCDALDLLGTDYLAFLAAQFGPHQCHAPAREGRNQGSASSPGA